MTIAQFLQRIGLRWDRFAGQRILVALGLALAVAEFAFNRSLWLDEAKLSRNFLTRNAWELLSPLDHQQVAPVGFLWLTEGSFELCRWLGIPAEYGLRTPALLAFAGVAYLTWALARRLTRSTLGGLTAVVFVCSNPYAIRYATEAKQYMLDTFVALLVYASALRIADSQRRHAVVGFALLGALCIWVSNIAVLFLACAGVHVVVSRFLAEGSLRWAWAPLAWVASLAVYYQLFVHGHPTRDFMDRYWDHAFLPWPPWSGEMGPFVTHHLVSMLRDTLAGPLWAPVVLVLAASLVWAIRRRNYRLVAYATAPVLLHLALSAMRLYPFAARMTLYLVPISGWLIGYLASEVAAALGNRRWFAPLAALPFVVPLAIGCLRFPFEKEEIKPALAYVNLHGNDNQSLYIYPPARHAFEIYRSEGLRMRMPEVTTELAAWREHDEIPASDLDALHAGVWLLFTYVPGPAAGPNAETDLIAMLQERGARLLDRYVAPGCRAYLIGWAADAR